MNYNCIIILGPTASGKTKLSVELAKKINGEIINGDSQQIIKGLNIGTAKVTLEEKEGIPHHLFDIVDVGEDFSVSEYSKLALDKIKEIQLKNKMPIIVGGTGFYINSILYNYTFGNTNKNENLRQYYESLAKEKGNEHIYSILKDLDPKSASKLHSNDVKRVIRAIEICMASGNKKSDQVLTKNPDINPYIIGLNVDRELLYDRINNRVDKMMEDGLEQEVNLVKLNGYYEKDYQLPIGYSEWLEFFNKKLSKEEVIEKIKQDSRHYAKRQITWFKRVEDVHWYNVTNIESIDNIVKDVCKIFI